MEDSSKLFCGGIPISRATNEGITELFFEYVCYPQEVVSLPPRDSDSNPETRCAFVRRCVDHPSEDRCSRYDDSKQCSLANICVLVAAIGYSYVANCRGIFKG
jgi:hypothetical protein